MICLNSCNKSSEGNYTKASIFLSAVVSASEGNYKMSVSKGNYTKASIFLSAVEVRHAFYSSYSSWIYDFDKQYS